LIGALEIAVKGKQRNSKVVLVAANPLDKDVAIVVRAECEPEESQAECMLASTAKAMQTSVAAAAECEGREETSATGSQITSIQRERMQASLAQAQEKRKAAAERSGNAQW